MDLVSHFLRRFGLVRGLEQSLLELKGEREHLESGNRGRRAFLMYNEHHEFLLDRMPMCAAG